MRIGIFRRLLQLLGERPGGALFQGFYCLGSDRRASLYYRLIFQFFICLCDRAWLLRVYGAAREPTTNARVRICTVYAHDSMRVSYTNKLLHRQPYFTLYFFTDLSPSASHFAVVTMATGAASWRVYESSNYRLPRLVHSGRRFLWL